MRYETLRLITAVLLACSAMVACGTGDGSGVADPSLDVVEGTDVASDAEGTSEDGSGDTGDPEDADEDDADTTPTDVEQDGSGDDAGDTTGDADEDGSGEGDTVDEEVDEGPKLFPPLPGPIDEVTRLVLIGDTGEGNDKQYEVSASIGRHCDEVGGCHAIVMLGDNIYDTGPESANDPLLEAYIDLPYAPLRFGPPPAEGEEDTRPRLPILMSLGNHDLGGAGLDASLANHYINYAESRDWLYFPDRTWHANLGYVHVTALDTNPLAYLGTELDEQGAVIREMLETTDAPHTLAFGHHPYRSNGRHGNAGSYEGVPGDLVFLGGRFREFVDDEICNKVDFYMCGHDHNRQWMARVPPIPSWWGLGPEPLRVECRTRFAVSGAGAKDDDIEDRNNNLAYGAPDEGFLVMTFSEDEVVAEFANAAGVVQWTETFR